MLYSVFATERESTRWTIKFIRIRSSGSITDFHECYFEVELGITYL